MLHHEQIISAWDEARAKGHDFVAGQEDFGFSWSPCHLCGSSLGGDRFQAFETDETGHFEGIRVCPCCLMAIANGDITACAEHCGEHK
jgi:hypothetical protein